MKSRVVNWCVMRVVVAVVVMVVVYIVLSS
jgi:hypothetical protein